MSIVKLFDESILVKELISESVGLVHATHKIAAIKLLITILELLELNLTIIDRFSNQSKARNEAGAFLYWDRASLKEFNYSRCALVLFHRPDFNPIDQLDHYNLKADRFIRLAETSVGERFAS